MGHKHSKPEPPSPVWLPGNCPTLFECHPKGKRSEVIKHAFAQAYEHEPVIVRCLMCLLLLLFVVGIGVAGWCVVSKRQARTKQVEAARVVDAEKGEFSDDI